MNQAKIGNICNSVGDSRTIQLKAITVALRIAAHDLLKESQKEVAKSSG